MASADLVKGIYEEQKKSFLASEMNMKRRNRSLHDKA